MDEDDDTYEPSELDHQTYMQTIEKISKDREGGKGASTADNIKVSVRIRPLNDRELRLKSKIITKVDSHDGCELLLTRSENNKVNRFRYDNVFDSHDPESDKCIDQKTVFEMIGLGICESAVRGFNTSLFAYGQTGSGKTHSMTGSKQDPGLIRRICDMIFFMHEQQKKSDSDLNIEVTASYLEIYNERCRDLLRPDTQELKLRDSPEKGPFVQGLTWLDCATSKDIEDLMEEGLLNRTTAATNMNAQSSRSHSIFSIYLSHKRREVVGNVMSETNKHSKVALIDLAGSESAKTTGATGSQLVESSNINRSLSCLGRCISELVKLGSSDKVSHVPYRDSVLTSLLKDCLGGNSKTNLLVAISPAEANYNESISTLRFAQQCKMIKTKAVVNEDHMTRLVADLKAEVERLKDELKQQTTGGNMSSFDAGQHLSSPQAPESATSVMEIWEALKKKRARDEMKKLSEKRKKHNKVLGAEGANAFTPYLTNVTADPMTTGTMKVFLLKNQPLVIGAPSQYLNMHMLSEGEGDELQSRDSFQEDDVPVRRINEGKTSRSFRQGAEAAGSFRQAPSSMPMNRGEQSLSPMRSPPKGRHGNKIALRRNSPSTQAIFDNDEDVGDSKEGVACEEENDSPRQGIKKQGSRASFKLPSYRRDLEMSGLGMEALHVRFHHTSVGNDKKELDHASIDASDFDMGDFHKPSVTIEACSNTADTYVNGHKLTMAGPDGHRVLQDGDRVVLGVCAQIFVYRQPTVDSVMLLRRQRSLSGDPNAHRRLNRSRSLDLDQEGLTVMKDFSYDRCVKEVILNRDESTHQRHERYARMCQSILRRKTFSRAFETNLVRALQQVQTANALASLFVGDGIWFEIHFAGGLGGGAGGWGQQLFSLSAHDVLRPEVVSVEVKCYFKSSGWLSDKTSKLSDSFQDNGSRSSTMSTELDVDEASMPTTLTSNFPQLSPSQSKPVSYLLKELKLENIKHMLFNAGVISVGDLRFVSDNELTEEGLSSEHIQFIRSHRLFTEVGDELNQRGVVDKLWSASPEELKRLWNAFTALDRNNTGSLQIEDIHEAVLAVTKKSLSEEQIKSFLARLAAVTTNTAGAIGTGSAAAARKVRNSTQFVPTTKQQRPKRSSSPRLTRPSHLQAQGSNSSLTSPTGRSGGERGAFFNGGSSSLTFDGEDFDETYNDQNSLSFADFARALLRNRGALKLDKRGIINGPESLVALMEQSLKRKTNTPKSSMSSSSNSKSATPPRQRPSGVGRSVSIPKDINMNSKQQNDHLRSHKSHSNVLSSASTSLPHSNLPHSPTAAASQSVLNVLNLDEEDDENDEKKRGGGERSKGTVAGGEGYEYEDYDDFEEEEDVFIDNDVITELMKKRKQSLLTGDLNQAATLTEELKRKGGAVLTRTLSSMSINSNDYLRMSTSCQDPSALQLFECGADAFDLFVDSLRLVATRVDSILSAIRKVDDWLKGLETHFDNPEDGANWMNGLGGFLEGANKEGLDFVDSLFDDLDRSNREALDKEDICSFLLEKLNIKDVMTVTELNLIFDDFFQEFSRFHQDESMNEDGGSIEDKLINRLGFHAFLKFILHYLFLLSITDLGDDPQYMFSHMEQLVSYAQGRGGSKYIAKRFTSAQSTNHSPSPTSPSSPPLALSMTESEIQQIKENDLRISKENDELKNQIEALEQQRKLDAENAEKEKARLKQVAQTLKLNDAKNAMLEQELSRMRKVLAGTKEKKTVLEKQVQELIVDDQIREEERFREKEKYEIENKIRKEYEMKKENERLKELMRKEEELRKFLLKEAQTISYGGQKFTNKHPAPPPPSSGDSGGHGGGGVTNPMNAMNGNTPVTQKSGYPKTPPSERIKEKQERKKKQPISSSSSTSTSSTGRVPNRQHRKSRSAPREISRDKGGDTQGQGDASTAGVSSILEGVGLDFTGNLNFVGSYF